MKLQFDANLDYQGQAVSSIIDLFKGQVQSQSLFTVFYGGGEENGQTGMRFTRNGIGNKVDLDDDEILTNLQGIQLRNGIKQSQQLVSRDFDIEMETGTGKTYVYLKSILELHKDYGFTKFIIVVPSIAIKEGVYKSLQITKEHFENLYDNVAYDYFVYDSGKLEQVRSFAVSNNIQIMVINIDAFRKSFTDPTKENKANIIHRPNDKLNGAKPIDLISETNPFVIIDEPQSVDTTVKSKEAIASLNPLCTFRYSATHVEKHNLIYRLDAVDSFNMGLVKQIEVASFASKDYHNNEYIKLISVDNKKMPITAKLELDILVKGKVKRKTCTVRDGDDLYEVSNGRDQYNNTIVNEIYCGEGNEYVEFSNLDDVLKKGETVGEIDDLAIKAQQIEKTIEEHLDKELILNPLGIKVLSLFFIDRVANYREYDEDGNPHQGIYAKIFEEKYNKLIKKPKYKNLLGGIDVDTPVEEVHDGYFSVDKKGKAKDTSGNTNDDDTAYNLIMRDKEKLLSFDSKLRFIFSHSALREGWDNPNVFQICTLNESKSEVKKRQEIGRGLRLCVDQDGVRKHGNEINTLTVMANESYEDFASKLQKEYEKDGGIRFGIIETHTFANVIVKDTNGEASSLGEEGSKVIYDFFEEKGYIDGSGRVCEELKLDLKNNKLEVPKQYEEIAAGIEAVCRKVSGNLNIKNADDKRTIHINKQVFLSPEFKELWDKIKYKTKYSVEFDTDELIQQCKERMITEIKVSSAKLIYTKAKLNVDEGGVDSTEIEHGTVNADNTKPMLPDIISYLQNKTNLTRRTIVAILTGENNRLDLFEKNPQLFMEGVAEIIKSVMRHMLVDGIKYTKIGDEEYYAQELFESEELTGYLNRNMIESKRSIYDYVVYDSSNEKMFAERFENNKDVKLFAKLPDWFKVSTPLGSYNPDWAVLIDNNGNERLYFVLETKGNTAQEELRIRENDKITCGHKHFEALGSDVKFEAIDDFNKFIEEAVSE